MGKQESTLKAKLKIAAKAELSGFVVFYVAGVGMDGVPDLSVNGYGRSSWLECKHCIGSCFSTKDNQELMCCRLAATGMCRYVVFDERGTTKRILIIDPRHVLGKRGKVADMIIEAQCVGYNYKWLCAWIKHWHQS